MHTVLLKETEIQYKDELNEFANSANVDLPTFRCQERKFWRRLSKYLQVDRCPLTLLA